MNDSTAQFKLVKCTHLTPVFSHLINHHSSFIDPNRFPSVSTFSENSLPVRQTIAVTAANCTSEFACRPGARFAEVRASRGIVADTDHSMSTPNRTAKSALDQFLPERLFAPDARQTGGATHIDPSEVQIEPIELYKRQAPDAVTPSSQVQAWPMFAAALVAVGVSLLAFAAFEKLGLP